MGTRERLAADARRLGWRQAMLADLAGDPPMLDYVGDERASDWRFLLPRPPRGTALVIGGALSPVPTALAETCRRVVVICPPADAGFLAARAADTAQGSVEAVPMGPGEPLAGLAPGRFDLVAGLQAPPDGRGPSWARLGPAALAARVAPGGSLYLEWDRPALLLPPARLRRRLRCLGFRRVVCYWPKPTFQHPEMLLPLGDRRLQRYYLREVFFAMSARRRALRRGLGALVELGGFELTLPGYMAVATRPQGEWHAGAH